MRRGMALVGILALLLLLRGPALMSAVSSNAGMLMLRDGLIAQTHAAPGTYPVYQVLDETSATARTMRSLHRAMALNGDNLSAQWALGRAALAAGDAETAISALGPLMRKVGRNSLLYQDVLIALSYGGRPEQVVALYESSSPLQRTQVVSDAVALAYLDLMTGRQGDKETRRQGDREQGEARQWLEQALVLRPGDLYVNYRLWRQVWETGDVGTAAVYSETLAYFPLETIHPADERVLNYVADAIPDLLEGGLWDRDKALNVVSFLVWQRNGAAGVERLLERLIEHYPNDPDWVFYLAELYHRRGDLERAEMTYRQVLAVDPAYAQAYLRLGMVSDAQIGESVDTQRLTEAARWYGQYHEMSPDDLLGLKKVAGVCTALEEAGTEDEGCYQAREALEGRTGDQRVVAELLGVPVERVELGPNLVENGGFEEWQGAAPVRWRWLNMANREPWGPALFFGGRDSLAVYEQGSSARVEGFWLQSKGQEPARAGYGYRESQVNLEPGHVYMLAFLYQTQLSEGSAGVWLSQDSGAIFAGESFLPATDRVWRGYVVLGRNTGSEIAPVWPLLRSWGEGMVWFDELRLREIRLPQNFEWPEQDAIFAVW